MNTLRIGLVSISDRASSGVYQDKGIPALEEWLARALTTPLRSDPPDPGRTADHRANAV
jgi:molybdopterin biosynthesis enzyme MoaB